MTKNLDELILNDSDTWDIVKKWMNEGKNEAAILPIDKSLGENTLLRLQITNRSTLGAIALGCGGLLVDKGWLRILGSGDKLISGSILSWNGMDKKQIRFSLNKALIVAYDVIGGFFAVNAGGLGNNIKNVYYFAPDSLEWEDIQMGYSDFIYWALNGDLNLFYKSFRWKNWEEDIAKLSGHEVIAVYPYLWSKEGKDIDKCFRSPIPVEEIWEIQNEFVNQIRNV